MVPYELTTYADVVNKALIIEREVNEECMERERKQRKRAKSNDTQGQNNKNIKRSVKGAIDNKTQQIDGEPCSRCGKNHADKDCYWNTGACFKCGQKDHKIVNCPLNTENQAGKRTHEGQHKSGRQISKIQGRVYALTQQNPQASNTMVTAMKNYEDEISF